MLAKKPWTVMVYLAADNNLFSFGVDSLRQMKVAARNNVNILAEFDTGPANRSKRYLFDGREPIGSIEDNVVETFGPTNAADPDNLARFIEWGATNYPADHYYVVIWGHGGGVDDDFPRQPDHSFVPRHSLLSLFKGTSDDNPKGTSDDVPKGTSDDVPKGTSDDVPKGTSDDNPKTVLNGHLKRILNSPLQEIADVLQIGDDALHMAVVDALQQAVSQALESSVLSDIEHFGFNASQKDNLLKLRDRILTDLKSDTLVNLESGVLGSLRLGILGALQQGIFDALQTGILYELQKAVVHALQVGETEAAIEQVRNVVLNVIFRFLENGMLEVQQMGLLDPSQKRVLPPTKSLAFVDHPEDFLTNAGLKRALALAKNSIYQKIDILGMDSCNMNMIEIGYDLRDSVDFLVASQDDIPDASWPYDRIIKKLVDQPNISPRELARTTAITYVDGYKDYVNRAVTAAQQVKLDQPVTLSVLDLDQCEKIVTQIQKLVDVLMNALRTGPGVNAISRARGQVRNFGDGQFIDLIHFCELLSEPDNDPASARLATPRSPVSTDPGVIQLSRTAFSLIEPLREIISLNQHSGTEQNCNGTSIYLPAFDPQQAEHAKRLGFLYQQLEFAVATKWGKFVAEFLNQQKLQLEAAQAFAKAKSKPPEPTSEEVAAELERVKQATEAAAQELNVAARKSKAGFLPLNGRLSAAARMASALALTIDAEIKSAVKVKK